MPAFANIVLKIRSTNGEITDCGTTSRGASLLIIRRRKRRLWIRMGSSSEIYSSSNRKMDKLVVFKKVATFEQSLI
jgi:hypothetical protein